MKKKNIADNAENQKLHELEQAEIEKEKANRTKIHIQSRVVMVAVTGGLCLVTAFFGIYLANRFAANKNLGSNSSSYSVFSNSSSSYASSNAVTDSSPVFTESVNNSDTVSAETSLKENISPDSNSGSASGLGSGTASVGGIGNIPFPPSGQISGAVSNNAPTGETNSSEFSDDGNSHMPDAVDTQTPDIATPDDPSQAVPPNNSGSNSGQNHPEGWSPFDDMPFFNHGGGGMESTGTVDEPISDTGITGEGFFH